MNIAIVGSRDFSDYLLMKKSILEYLENKNINILEIKNVVSGGARGADKLGKNFADEFSINAIIHEPEWDKYDKAAGYIRNKKIVADADIVFAFWDGESKGTKHSIDLTQQMHKEIIVIKFDKKNPISDSSISILKKLLSRK